MRPEEEGRRLVPTVRVAQSIFGAQAASVMLRDGDELVFAAVSGDGEGALEGRRIPLGTGVAGWVATSRQPIVLEDVRSDPRFAADVAASTGYVPKGLMAVPLEDDDERVLGVLSVLDRPLRAEFSLLELELLGLLAEQAAGIVTEGRRSRGELGGVPPAVTDLVAALQAVDGERRAAADQLLEALTRLLAP